MKISTRHHCIPANTPVALTFVESFKHRFARVFFAIVFVLIGNAAAIGQLRSGDHMLLGDLTVDEGKVAGLKPLTFDVILYSETRVLISRQTVSSNGRYRFN